MWDVQELFVFSDLHLAAERDTGLFRADAELADCLRWVLDETREGVVVLAGDFLDFLTLDDGRQRLDFDLLGANARRIIEHHPEVFDALTGLAHSPRHRLVIMGGNHDPEFVFPTVQESVERRLGVGFMNSTVRWHAQGEALRVRVGDAVVLVEHGNSLDPWNRIDHAGLQSALSLASRNLSDVSDYQPPPGSRMVLGLVNKLRQDYGWVDCLKPETEAVLPLLWHFSSWEQRRLIFSLADEYLSMKVFAHNLSKRRDPERLFKGEKETEDSQKDQAFKDWVDAIHEEERLTFSQEKHDARLIRKLQSISARDTFFDHEAPDDSVAYLRPVFEGGADLVIHGHTHSAKACATDGGFYINTGTWGQLLRLPGSGEGENIWRDFLDSLRTSDVEYFRCPTFARVRRAPGRGATTAALLKWRQSGPETLASRLFSGREPGWHKDG